jgi:hypothetical protein
MRGDKVVRDGDVEFTAMGPGHLGALTAIAQCLDSHWVPRPLLGRMLERGDALAGVAGERLGAVRTEYLRALLTARQVVVSRACLYNNPAVARDVLSAGPDREALCRLLDAGAVVPFLLAESSPCDRPEHRVDERAFAAWQRLCREVRTHCLRLAWTEEENARAIQRELHRRFGWFASGIHQLEVPALERCLGLHAGDDDAALQRILVRVALWCAAWAGEGRAVTRDDLYRTFVVADGTPPAEGRYDRRKPFAGALKLLFDLRHNAGLPDAVGRFHLIPADALPRAALQEWPLPEAGPARLTAADLAALVRGAAAPLAGPGATLESIGALSLGEVEHVRGTEAWAEYAERLERLLRGPLDLADPTVGAVAVYEAYVRLAQVATAVARRRNPRQRTVRWAPVLELQVEAGGAVVSAVPALLGRDPSALLAAGRPARADALPVSVTMVVRGRDGHDGLALGVHLLRGRLDAPGEQWPELLAALGHPGGEEPSAGELPSERVATLERSQPGPV